MYSQIMEDVRKCIRLEEPTRVPYFPLGLEFDVTHSGKALRHCRRNPDVMIDVIASATADFDYDWVIVHPDDLGEYESMGIEVTDEENLPPAVRTYLPFTEESVDRMVFPEIGRDGRMPWHLEVIRGLKQRLGGQVCVTGRIAAPFSACGLLFGVEPILMGMIENPDLLTKAMRLLEDYNVRWAQAQVESGADAIWLGDCLATSYFISPDNYRQHAAGPADTASKGIQRCGGIVLYHGGEISLPHLEIAAELSFDTINIGEHADLAEVKERIGGKVCLMGNLDPIRVLREGTPDKVQEETSKTVLAGKVGGGYIFCTGEGVTHDTPVENVLAMTQAVRKCGQY
ncbi:MAG TPA: hypothetical protein ENH84_01055 [Phycisphaerae bacterium]|nr:hypothetical protein [Phycisphaerae bacterium]